MLEKKKKFSIKTKLPFILASGSQVRKKILEDTGLHFKTITSEIDEDFIKRKFKGRSYTFISKKLAQAKAIAVSRKYNNHHVIGADQICVYEKKILHKPLNKNNAIIQLSMLSGNEHKQISGCSVCWNGKVIYSFSCTAKLKMRKITKKQISNYVDIDNPINSCGSYKYESKGYLLFSKVIGDQFTIQGMPIFDLFNFLIKRNIIKYE